MPASQLVIYRSCQHERIDIGAYIQSRCDKLWMRWDTLIAAVVVLPCPLQHFFIPYNPSPRVNSFTNNGSRKNKRLCLQSSIGFVMEHQPLLEHSVPLGYLVRVAGVRAAVTMVLQGQHISFHRSEEMNNWSWSFSLRVLLSHAQSNLNDDSRHSEGVDRADAAWCGIEPSIHRLDPPTMISSTNLRWLCGEPRFVGCAVPRFLDFDDMPDQELR